MARTNACAGIQPDRRVASDGDGRARVLRLTGKGRNLTKIIQQRAAEIERRWAEVLGPARTRELVAALEDLDALGVASVAAR